jgi:hypothetical protein
MTWAPSDGEKLSDAITWLNACKAQIQRYLEAESISATVMRHARTEEQRRQVAMGWADGHFLCIAAKHLADALGRVRKRHGIGQLSAETQENAKGMRDALEHWTSTRWHFQNRDQADHDAEVPNPWSRGYSNVSGHRFGSLSVDQLSAEIAAIEPLLRAAIDEYRAERGPRPIPVSSERVDFSQTFPTAREALLCGWVGEPEIVADWSNGDDAFALLRFEDEHWPNGYPYIAQASRTSRGWRVGGGGNGGGGLWTLKRDARGYQVESREVESSVHSVTWTWADGVSITVEPRNGWAFAVREDVGADDELPRCTVDGRAVTV